MSGYQASELKVLKVLKLRGVIDYVVIISFSGGGLPPEPPLQLGPLGQPP